MLKAPIRPSRKNPITLIAFFVFFIYSYFLMVAFVFISKPAFSMTLLGIKQELISANYILTFLTLLFFFLSYLRDPGYLKNDKIEFIKLLEEFEAT
jgi:hypothetical protein